MQHSDANVLDRRDPATVLRKLDHHLLMEPNVHLRWWRTVLYRDAEPMQNFAVAEETTKVPEVKF